MRKNSKEFKIKVKFLSMSEKERKKLLFQFFDILLSTKPPQKKTDKN